ncbi:MAG: AraC family transcriptional regulator [Pseudomonadota bacterium]
MLDVLSDILSRLDLQGTLYFRTSFTPPWAVEVPAFSNVARFHFAYRGQCQVRVAGEAAPIELAQGDLLIIPHGASHTLLSGQGEDDPAPLDRVLEQSGFGGSGVLVWGGADTDRETQLICGHFAFAEGRKHCLIDNLPSHIHIRNYGEKAGRWMDATLRMIGDEAEGDDLGADLVALRLSEVILAQALRAYLGREGRDRVGLAGFADAHLSRALAGFHATPAESWTVERMATEAGLSRSAFAERFMDKFGVSTMRYVTSWRMLIARERLVQGAPIGLVAEAVGYASESAFSRVFRQETGLSPGRYRAARRVAEVG